MPNRMLRHLLPFLLLLLPLTAQELAPHEPAVAAAPARLVNVEVEGIRLILVMADAEALALDLIDQPDGPASRYPEARAARAAHPACVAVVNGGFFGTDGEPIGLRRDGGRTLSPLAPPGNLYFGVVGDDGEAIRIETLAEWRARPSRDLEAIQSGPRLVWDGQAVAGLSTTRPAMRTFVALGSRGEVILGQSAPCTLAALARALAGLAQAGGGELVLDRALNLDGGRSCDLWVRADIAGDEAPTSRTPLANPVRDFLALRLRNSVSDGSDESDR